MTCRPSSQFRFGPVGARSVTLDFELPVGSSVRYARAESIIITPLAPLSMQKHPAVTVESESLLTEASPHCTMGGRARATGRRARRTSFTTAAATASESIRLGVLVGARPADKIMVNLSGPYWQWTDASDILNLSASAGGMNLVVDSQDKSGFKLLRRRDN